MIIYIIFAILIVLVFAVIQIYNSLIVLKNRVSEAWADIEVQLKRRYDLIPNIVETVKGYAAHEKETFEKVIQARNAAMSAKSVDDKAQAEGQLAGMLKNVFALAESYPDLKANQNFQHLQMELSDTENKIQAARRFYNGNVRDYNTAVETFPANIFSTTMGFGKKEFFEIENPEERKTPQVKF